VQEQEGVQLLQVQAQGQVQVKVQVQVQVQVQGLLQVLQGHEPGQVILSWASFDSFFGSSCFRL